MCVKDREAAGAIRLMKVQGNAGGGDMFYGLLRIYALRIYVWFWKGVWYAH